MGPLLTREAAEQRLATEKRLNATIPEYRLALRLRHKALGSVECQIAYNICEAYARGLPLDAYKKQIASLRRMNYRAWQLQREKSTMILYRMIALLSR